MTAEIKNRDDFRSARDIGENHPALADLWLPKMVDQRLVEAAKIIMRTGGATGPKGAGNAWPTFIREFSDLYDPIKDDFGNVIGHVPTAAAERPRFPIPAKKITRMEQAIHWPVTYLSDQDGPRRVLAVYLRCRAYRKPFNKACEDMGWPRATAYRAREKALSAIAQGLNKDSIPIG